MAVAKLMAVGVCAGIFDRVAEREKRLVRRLGQRRRVSRRSDDGHAGDLPTDLGVVPVHPDRDVRNLLLFWLGFLRIFFD